MKNDKEKPIRLSIKKPGSVKKNVLEVIDYLYRDRRDIEITIRQPEFTSLCPMTGLPDFGAISIVYTPDQKIVELKSLKFYLLQYRNVGIFYEHVINQILDDLVAVLKPRRMAITGSFTARGGITTEATGQYEGV
jgi:7-cyano-7-deazaguanine reductase